MNPPTKKFVIGDIHGRIEALKQVLTKSTFNYETDKLIILGDVCDGGKNTKEVVNELLKIKNKVFVRGNHDQWLLDFINKDEMPSIWTSQGGWATINSYGLLYGVKVPKKHQKFFNDSILYHEEDNMLFVHGGFRAYNGTKPKDEEPQVLMWNRDLINWCEDGNKIPDYTKVFIGHTTTQVKDMLEPTKFQNLIMMDCGGGWNGKLALMNINTEEYWLSDIQIPNEEE